MTKALFVFLLLCMGSGESFNLRAQSTSAATQGAVLFEVVSVRERPGIRGPGLLISEKWTADSYVAEGIPLDLLVSKAYGVRPDTVTGGPSWIHEKTFDLSAKVAETDVSSLGRMSVRQKNALLKQVLDSRFHLKAHSESKTAPIYQLVATGGRPQKTNGLQLSADAPAEQAAKRRIAVSGIEILATDVPMTQLASVLWGIVGRPVVDNTGLAGVFSFDLRFTPEDKILSGSDQQAGPSIFTALREQLGLELHSSKGPVDMLVIDGATLPTAN